MRRIALLIKTHDALRAAVMCCGIAVFTRAASAQTCGTADTQDPAAARASLAEAEQDASAIMVEMGLGEALPGIVGDSGALLVANAPVIRGRDNVLRTMTQGSYRRMKQRWQPLRVLVSRDGKLGATFGISVIESGGGRPAALGRYITVWRCDAGSSWQVVAHVDVRATAPALQLPANMPPSPAESPRDAFARTDLDFAKMAGDSGAGPAFGRFAAPDAIMFASSGELMIGPTQIRARMSEGRPGTQWRWRPVLSFAAASGDLGATIGEAEIRPTGSPPAYTKYLTVWQKQADGSLKFVVDAGNSRPTPR